MSLDAPLTSTTTVPSNPSIKTTPSSEPFPAKPSPNASLLRQLYVLLLRRITHLARSTDTALLRLSKLLSTPSGIDALLCTVSYTLDLLSTLLSRHVARTLIATPVLVSEYITVKEVVHPHVQLEKLAAGGKKLAGVISDYRIFFRLWGLVGVYTWARSTYTSPLLPASSTADRLLRYITWTQVLSGIAFQVLENGAYLSSKGVFWNSEIGIKREVRWWVWSSRFWAAHVGLEFLRLYVQSRVRGNDRKARAEEEKLVDDGEKERKLLKAARRKENRLFWRDVLSNAAYAPMTLHWSVEEGLLSELGVGVLGIVAGGTLLVDQWIGTN